jgi:hypothetical protein
MQLGEQTKCNKANAMGGLVEYAKAMQLVAWSGQE